MVANPRLVEQRKIPAGKVGQINELHAACEDIEEYMELADSVDDYDYLRQLYAEWTGLQFRLQELWGFSQNKAKHQSWYLPGCTCPKMDNADMGEHMYITKGCPLHDRL